MNLTYSSNHMTSNQLTRNEVVEIYHTNKISTIFEPIKVNNIFVVINHLATVRYIIDNITTPLTQAF